MTASSWPARHAIEVQAYSSVVLVVITAIYALLTRKLARAAVNANAHAEKALAEGRRARLLSSTPTVIVTLIKAEHIGASAVIAQTTKRAGVAIDLEVRNHGPGPAFFEVKAEPPSIAQVALVSDPRPIAATEVRTIGVQVSEQVGKWMDLRRRQVEIKVWTSTPLTEIVDLHTWRGEAWGIKQSDSTLINDMLLIEASESDVTQRRYLPHETLPDDAPPRNRFVERGSSPD